MPSCETASVRGGQKEVRGMKSIRVALVLVTIGVFHPGLALFVVWLVTMGFALRMMVGGWEGEPANLVRVSDRPGERTGPRG